MLSQNNGLVGVSRKEGERAINRATFYNTTLYIEQHANASILAYLRSFSKNQNIGLVDDYDFNRNGMENDLNVNVIKKFV